MNFLLHHHLATRDLGGAVAGVGAMLPDLWATADRRVRPASLPSAPAHVVAPPLGDLLRGIDHHLAADRWFHADEAFVDGERAASRRLRQAALSARHATLFAHVLWELCLDGELVRRSGIGAVVRLLSDGINEAGSALAESVELHHFSRVVRSPDDHAAFEQRFRRICRELVRGPWIAGYQSAAGLAARVQGVRARVGLERMGADDEGRLAGVAGGLLELAVDAVDRILATPTFVRSPWPAMLRPLAASTADR